MRIKAKLRRIGNSMGVILPADVITGREKGDSIEIDVITEVITDTKGVLANPVIVDVPSVQTVPT